MVGINLNISKEKGKDWEYQRKKLSEHNVQFWRSFQIRTKRGFLNFNRVFDKFVYFLQNRD